MKRMIVWVVSVSLVFGFYMIAGLGATTLTLWDWSGPRMEIVKPYLDEYERLNPDISFETMVIPWSDYWPKVLAGIAAGTMPDIFHFHNAKTAVFHDALEPFPEDLFPLDKMRQEYFSFDPAYVFNDRFYFLPGWIMIGVIYYNVDMWEEAGLGAPPKTWEELRTIAKALTRYDEKGNVERAGFQFMGEGNMQWLWYDLLYQQGGWIYNAEGTGVELYSPAGLKALEFIWSLVFQDKVTQPGFLNPWEAFGTGKAAMIYAWTWTSGWLDYNYPDLKWNVFALPTESGGNLPARGRNNYECGYAVPKGAKNKAEAFRFLKWLWDQDDFIVELCTKAMGSLPGKLALWDDPRIQEDKTLRVLADVVPYTVFPGELPPWLTGEVMADLETRMIDQGVSPDEALQIAQQEGDRAFKEKPVEWIVERQYHPPEE